MGPGIRQNAVKGNEMTIVPACCSHHGLVELQGELNCGRGSCRINLLRTPTSDRAQDGKGKTEQSAIEDSMFRVFHGAPRIFAVLRPAAKQFRFFQESLLYIIDWF